MWRLRARRLQLHDALCGPARDGALGLQLQCGDAAVPGGGGGAGAAGRRHAVIRLPGMMKLCFLSL